MEIVFKIKTSVAQQIVDKLVKLYPIPKIGGGDPFPLGETEPQYTEKEWVKLLIKKWIVEQYNRQIKNEYRQQEIEGLLKEEDIFEI